MDICHLWLILIYYGEWYDAEQVMLMPFITSLPRILCVGGGGGDDGSCDGWVILEATKHPPTNHIFLLEEKQIHSIETSEKTNISVNHPKHTHTHALSPIIPKSSRKPPIENENTTIITIYEIHQYFQIGHGMEIMPIAFGSHRAFVPFHFPLSMSSIFRARQIIAIGLLNNTNFQIHQTKNIIAIYVLYLCVLLLCI